MLTRGSGLVGALPSTLPTTGLCASYLRLQFLISGPRQAGRVVEPTWHVASVHGGSRLQENVTLGSLDSEGSHCHKAVSSVGTAQHPSWELQNRLPPARPPHPSLPFTNHTGRLQMSLGSWPQMSLAGELGSPKGPIQASAGLWKPTQDPGGPARPGDGVGVPPLE